MISDPAGATDAPPSIIGVIAKATPIPTKQPVTTRQATEHGQSGEPLAVHDNQVAQWMRLLLEPDQVTELRALKVSIKNSRPAPYAGYYDAANLEKMVADGRRLTPNAAGVYFVFNPLHSDVIARRQNRIDYAQQGDQATDRDVVRRRWLMIDIDPKRPSGISATDAEKEQSLATTRRVQSYLTNLNWPTPILADSGNGFHLLYRIDLPTQDGGLIKRCLEALANQFNTPEAEIDTTVFNPSRLCKVPGTWARKGDDLPDRPHRRARLMEGPGVNDTTQPAIVSNELLEQLAGPASPRYTPSQPTGSQPNSNANQSRLMVERWLTDRGVGFRVKPSPDSHGRIVYALDYCPFDPNHKGPDSCIMQGPDGRLSAKCFHSSCGGRGWQAFKQAIGAPDQDHYDPPLTKTRREPSSPPVNDGDQLNAVSPTVKPNRVIDDPFVLARSFLDMNYRLPTGEKTLSYFRETWYAWREGVWIETASDELEATIMSHVEKIFIEDNLRCLAVWQATTPKERDDNPPTVRKVTITLTKNVVQSLVALTIIPATMEPPCWLDDRPTPDPRECLFAPNGIIHLPTFVAKSDDYLTPPTPKLFNTTAIPFEFTLTPAEPSEWLRFLHSSWPNDIEAINLLQQFFGYCLTPDTRLQKALVIIGPPRSGKGTISKVQTSLVGELNTAPTTLGALSERFGLWPLLGKTLAVISDAHLSGRADATVITERLKSIIGEDPQQVDRKSLSMVNATLGVRFCIFANEVPRFRDSSGVIASRILALRMTRSHLGKEDKTLIDRLRKELPGILHWAIDGWARLRHQGQFHQPASSLRIIEEIKSLAANVTTFVEERCRLGTELAVAKDDLYREWVGWCEKNGRRTPGDKSTFGRDLYAAYPSLDEDKPRDGSKRVSRYTGIDLIEGFPTS